MRIRRSNIPRNEGEGVLETSFFLKVALGTDAGQHSINHDSMLAIVPQDRQILSHKGALFIVADGFQTLSYTQEPIGKRAVDLIHAGYYQEDKKNCRDMLVQAIQQANAQLHQIVWKQSGNASYMTAGSTCAAIVLCNGMAYSANVGSDRVYLVRHGQARQCSRDHTWVAEQVRAGLLTREQAHVHPKRNLLYNWLGDTETVEVDTFVEPIQDGDIWVVCTDGLHSCVTDEELSATVEPDNPHKSLERLISLAKERGEGDNITAMVIKVFLRATS